MFAAIAAITEGSFKNVVTKLISAYAMLFWFVGLPVEPEESNENTTSYMQLDGS